LRTETRGEIITSDFFDIHQQTLAESVLKYTSCNYFYAGGYEDAERKRLVTYPDYMEKDEQWAEISVLDLRGKFDYVKVTHRDYLGAIMSAGIKREKFGDLLVSADGVYVFADKAIVTYMLSNLPKVKGVNLSGREISPQEVILPEGDKKEISVTCASLRLDVVAASGFNLSRSQIQELIKAHKVQVNHREVTETDYRLEQNDVISVRGKGKLQLAEINGNTKKGKIKIKLIKYGG